VGISSGAACAAAWRSRAGSAAGASCSPSSPTPASAI
jgi:hypothetical protein